MRLLFFFIVALTGSYNAFSQVVIKEDPNVTRIMQNFENSNKSPEKTMNGWRVQISASVDRKQIEITKKQFQRDFPQYPITSSYDNPYYKLKAGAFSHQNKAEAALANIKSKYKNAYLTRDIIKTMELGKDSE